jgi:RNA polymerase primary sigma factor
MRKPAVLISTDEINHYIKDIRKIPIVSHQRQDEIFKLLLDFNTTKIEKDKLLEELVLGNLRFVISVAKMYQGQGMDLLDLISEGNIGLIKATERFDPNSGLKFISYAVWWVKQSIMASLNDNARTIRLPSNLVQEAQKNKRNETNKIDKFYTDGNIPPEKNAKKRLCPIKSVGSTPVISNNGDTSSTQDLNELAVTSINE